MRSFALSFLAALAIASPAVAERREPDIRTDDVDRFYRLYDAAQGHPTAEVLQRDYLDAGSPAVREFIPNRIVSAERLARRVGEKPEVYAKARTCAAALPEVRTRLNPAFRKLVRLYPQAKLPAVTILIGRNNSGGTTGPSGALIGLEVICATVRPDETLADRFVHLIAHEYGHVQQPLEEPEGATVLQASLIEGTAELIAELTTGRIANHHLIAWTKGREREIGEAFLRDAAGKDKAAWLYNGIGTPEKPGDLGYWQGWRIAKRYYDRAPDKKTALAELIALKDPQAILAASGWKPGD
jgi:hypothetical protein